MRFEILFAPAARDDIVNIRAYVAAQDGQNRADWVNGELERVCSSLVDMPERGNVPEELERAGSRSYREHHYKPYRIIYRIFESRVIVFGVFDGRRDMQTLLRQRLMR
jgi:toxin ParE1/3/4